MSGGGQGGSPVDCNIVADSPAVLAVEVGLGGHVHNFKAYYLDLDRLTPDSSSSDSESEHWKDFVKTTDRVGRTHGDTVFTNDMEDTES